MVKSMEVTDVTITVIGRNGAVAVLKAGGQEQDRTTVVV
jgi:hypothetical protein